jgi:peptide-methionine (S)-S-oxide reductase
MTEERAVLAGGCFWGVQDLIRRRDGVLSTRVGYTGGTNANATYRNHGTHAEAVEIIFDPARISYREILEFFFQIHDPSTRNRQGKAVTEVVPATDFWEAEPEHQDYLERYPGGYTCHFVRPNWRLPIRSEKVVKQA